MRASSAVLTQSKQNVPVFFHVPSPNPVRILLPFFKCSLELSAATLNQRSISICHRCKYGNCKHIDDDGCAVRENWRRHNWYVELYLELEAAAAVQRARAASKKSREGNVKFKTKGGSQSMEVLLDPKKHRNVSRRQVSNF